VGPRASAARRPLSVQSLLQRKAARGRDRPIAPARGFVAAESSDCSALPWVAMGACCTAEDSGEEQIPPPPSELVIEETTPVFSQVADLQDADGALGVPNGVGPRSGEGIASKSVGSRKEQLKDTVTSFVRSSSKGRSVVLLKELSTDPFVERSCAQLRLSTDLQHLRIEAPGVLIAFTLAGIRDVFRPGDDVEGAFPKSLLQRLADGESARLLRVYHTTPVGKLTSFLLLEDSEASREEFVQAMRVLYAKARRQLGGAMGRAEPGESGASLGEAQKERTRTLGTRTSLTSVTFATSASMVSEAEAGAVSATPLETKSER